MAPQRETADNDRKMPDLPSYSSLTTSLDGSTQALSRLIDAVRGLFESAGTQTGYEAAVDELKAAHDAAVDWCSAESKRHAVT